ncbi:hypothetical protein shim_29720 [Shimia sp. SK013]|uniref:luciferase domain-containing protein n=1 Tax=Shimia sp. SK013 TaxID=1389006 RepID=UPI0006B51656|nr:luciferase family protein [Shimia sp. SK013]KPA20725.1 hypothetical protein shim_29720 [Shimia sp. SK013]
MKNRIILSVATLFTNLLASALLAESLILPLRDTPIPRTTNSVPHIQIGVEPNPELSNELVARVSAIPGIELRRTVISLPGARGFWISDDVTIQHPEVIVGGREFAHQHPDGSLHASLSPELAEQAISAGWAVSHPWADQRPGWEGFVMIFTPLNREELDVVFDLVVASFEYVTGQSVETK